MNLVTREALLSFRRARTLSALSVTTIAFALFVTGLFGLVALNLHGAIRQVAERVQVVAFIKRDTPSQQIIGGDDRHRASSPRCSTSSMSRKPRRSSARSAN